MAGVAKMCWSQSEQGNVVAAAAALLEGSARGVFFTLTSGIHDHPRTEPEEVYVLGCQEKCHMAF